jgi:uncharacterized protein (DUF2141 family)
MKISAIFVFLILFSLSLKSQNILTIDIQMLSNNKGSILFELCDETGNFVTGLSEKINNNRCFIIINNLKPGKYSFKYFHDENGNKALDTNWIGIPTEGFGFSNNVWGIFGPPAVEKTIFEINGNVTKTCMPKYY